ncbi:MAG: replication initiation protein [Rickettsiaceae bacterium]|nr:replication initiation protein [Rickettsiaceae bacterium]
MSELEEYKDEALTKSNNIINTQFPRDMNLNHYKLVHAGLIQLQRACKGYGVDGAEDDPWDRFYVIDLNDFCDSANLKSKGNFSSLKKEALDLPAVTDIKVKNAKGGMDSGSLVRFVRQPERYSSKIELQFEKNFREHFETVEYFARIFYIALMGYKSLYSLRWYEIFSSHAYRKEITFEVAEIKKKFNIEDMYSKYSSFKNNVIKNPIDEINDKSKFQISYSENYAGKRVDSFTFIIGKKSNSIDSTQDIPLILANDLVDLFNDVKIYNKSTQDELIKLVEDGAIEKGLIEYTIGKAKRDHSKSPKKNLQGFIIKAIREKFYNEEYTVIKLKEQSKIEKLGKKEKDQSNALIIRTIEMAWNKERSYKKEELLENITQEDRDNYIKYLEKGNMFQQSSIENFKQGKTESEFVMWLMLNKGDKTTLDIIEFAKKNFGVNLIKYDGSYFIKENKVVVDAV